MDMQRILQQARKMQKEIEKKQAALEETLFEITSAGGAIKVSIYGNYHIEKVEIDKDMIDSEDKEMLEDSISIAINEAIEKVQAEQAKITNSMTANAGFGGFGF